MKWTDVNSKTNPKVRKVVFEYEDGRTKFLQNDAANDWVNDVNRLTQETDIASKIGIVFTNYLKFWMIGRITSELQEPDPAEEPLPQSLPGKKKTRKKTAKKKTVSKKAKKIIASPLEPKPLLPTSGPNFRPIPVELARKGLPIPDIW